MCLQKFKTTVFVPKLSHFTEIVEIDVTPYDTSEKVNNKLLRKLAIYKSGNGALLSNSSNRFIPNLSRVISYETTNHKKYFPKKSNNYVDFDYIQIKTEVNYGKV